MKKIEVDVERKQGDTMQNITKEWLKENKACSEGVKWWEDNGSKKDAVTVLRSLLESDHFQWANWTIVRLMDRKQKIQYAIFAAEQVLDIFEKKYPKDDRPRKAIEAARKVLEADTQENRKAADAAAYAYAAAAYADAYADAYAAARKKMQKTILEYGISLLVGTLKSQGRA